MSWLKSLTSYIGKSTYILQLTLDDNFITSDFSGQKSHKMLCSFLYLSVRLNGFRWWILVQINGISKGFVIIVPCYDAFICSGLSLHLLINMYFSLLELLNYFSFEMKTTILFYVSQIFWELLPAFNNVNIKTYSINYYIFNIDIIWIRGYSKSMMNTLWIIVW